MRFFANTITSSRSLSGTDFRFSLLSSSELTFVSVAFSHYCAISSFVSSIPPSQRLLNSPRTN
jgi:hypothetical protein